MVKAEVNFCIFWQCCSDLQFYLTASTALTALARVDFPAGSSALAMTPWTAARRGQTPQIIWIKCTIFGREMS